MRSLLSIAVLLSALVCRGASIYGTSPPRYLSIIGTTRTGKASL